MGGAGRGARALTAFVLGLTGPMGAGKTTVAAMLRELGAKVLDADAIARDELLRGTVGYSAVVQQFGTGVLGPDKEVDRAKLAAEVFADPAKLLRLERILHPRVIARVLEARAMLPDDAVLAVEAIKLLETPLRRVCERIWVVLADRRVLLERLRGRGVEEADALARLAHQAGEAELRAAADLVIANDGDRADVRRQVEEGWRALRG
ncbi:MAG TPA: dephospho-CoA kinase [Candidatus Limnocylindrales bacterium]|nr:dephospho-CoA kinase [Candidatus Limnocylindrales bacterium]